MLLRNRSAVVVRMREDISGPPGQLLVRRVRCQRDHEMACRLLATCAVMGGQPQHFVVVHAPARDPAARSGLPALRESRCR